MGSILSRRIAGVEDIDIQANSAYRYPPKSAGNYFASHFFMGGEKFDTPHPEGYLFGENMDLNFLGSRPVQFPYVTPAPHEPVKTLRSLVNIRKDSLRLVRYKEDADSPTEDGEKPRVLYSLEFTFDADARVAITIYCQAVEELVLRESSSPESFGTEEGDEPSLKQGSRVPSIDDVLQDGSPQHHGCSQPVPPADIYLPGWSTSMETPHSLGTTSSPWPLLSGSSPEPGVAELTPF